MNKLSSIFRPPFSIAPRRTNKLLKEKETVSKSYKLLCRYGIIHQSSTGMYHILPMGQRVIDKLVKLIEQHMRLIQAQKMTLPLLTPQHLWKKAGTYENSEKELFEVDDRQGSTFILSPTHEQSMSTLLSEILMSYRDFPQLLYQITPKFRDEHRAKLGLIRSKEFLMKDLYSFDVNAEEAVKTYDKVTAAYDKIFQTLGINYYKSNCTSEEGVIKSHEYFYKCEVGDDKSYFCSACESINPATIVKEKNSCPDCFQYIDEKNFCNALEVAHTFSYGTHFSNKLGSYYVDIDCQRTPLHMCSYGIGISRLLSAVVESLATTEDELRWPLAIAPYSICIIPPKDGSHEAPEVELLLPELYQWLECVPHLKNDIIVDNRCDKTIGKRLLEAKHFGFPFVVVASKEARQSTPLFELHDINNGKYYLMPKSTLTHYLSDQMKTLDEETPKPLYLMKL